jgi:hypothetical protein
MIKCPAGYSCPKNTGYAMNIKIMEIKDFTNLIIKIYDTDNRRNATKIDYSPSVKSIFLFDFK